MKEFKPGTKYSTRLISDSQAIIEVHVQKRTAKTIIARVDGQTKTLRIFMHDGVECVRPLGNYSMAPIVRASSIAF